MTAVTMTPGPTLLDAFDVATYAGARPATLRVWRLRYGMTPWRSRSSANLYDLAEVLARRVGDG
jgi:hypothetical protein